MARDSFLLVLGADLILILRGKAYYLALAMMEEGTRVNGNGIGKPSPFPQRTKSIYVVVTVTIQNHSIPKIVSEV
ncbi:carbamoyl phosphate synthetase, glutamine amidotransferase small [Sesbania bispinosa]|nr:carbamoyl phosphate synthetase, glutamine amidotransferase small [Sesbania bispinosa]